MAEEHTVEYRSIDYYSMCEKSKAKIKAMQDAGFSTPYDAKSTPEETEMPKMGGYSIMMMGKQFYQVDDCPVQSDVESAIDFTWELLFLSPWELVYIGIPMSVLAFYVLTIYAIFKAIQKKYS